MMVSYKQKKSEGESQVKISGNRERILAAALHLFTTQGFHATPIAQILKEANLSTGTLFYYFPDKKTLIDELYISIKKDLAETILTNDDANLPIHEQFERLFQTYVAWGITNPEKHKFLMQFSNSPNIGEEVKREARQDFERLHEMIKTAIKEGILTDIPYAFYSVMIGQILAGIIILIEKSDSNMTQEEIIKNCLYMFIKH